MELNVNRLSKQYKNKIAVDRVSYTFEEGIYGLLGANGAGKTTFMRMLCGILEPTSGEVSYNGISVAAEEYRAALGYLPQDFGYYPGFTGYDFLLYMAALKGLGRGHAKKKAKELLRFVSLEDMAKKKIKTYSGGMKQRVALARAYAMNPSLLLMDEPFGALDAQTRYQMEEEVLRIWEKEKRTVIFVTNNIEEAVYLGDRIILLSECPARVKAVYPIDLPRPRNQIDPAFLRIRESIEANTDLAL